MQSTKHQWRQQPWLGVGLWLYDLIQYVWKLAQWVILTPLISVLLVLLGLVRLLANIPFLQSTLIGSATATINYVVLHWIASMQVYLLDYSRSASLRQRFDHEVETLLDDPACERLVVIAHSMGTVISYEGLTTLLVQPEWQRKAAGKKQITYICLAQALRRIWLLSRTDPERLRGVLPEQVRWLHFWARYDPVAVGPLDPHALPPPDRRASPRVRAANQALCMRLAQVENVDVVNTDSIYADHTTYWLNVEQVVGPIARELVSGHPELERLTEQHLATREHVVQRRWGVAWRAVVALATGFGLAALLVVLDALHRGGLGNAVAGAVGAVLGSPAVQQFLNNNTFDLYTLISTYLSQCVHGAGACSGVGNLTSNPNLIVPYLLAVYFMPAYLATAIAALVILVLGIEVGSWLVAAPSPFTFREATATRAVLVLTVLGLVIGTVGLLVAIALPRVVDVPFDPHSLPPVAAAYLWIIGVAEFFWFLALGVTVIDTLQGRRLGWLVGVGAARLSDADCAAILCDMRRHRGPGRMPRSGHRRGAPPAVGSGREPRVGGTSTRGGGRRPRAPTRLPHARLSRCRGAGGRLRDLDQLRTAAADLEKQGSVGRRALTLGDLPASLPDYHTRAIRAPYLGRPRRRDDLAGIGSLGMGAGGRRS
ncbi:MAG: hypothetical protein ACLQUY_05315 [Ktedonobacterales bacterium]